MRRLFRWVASAVSRADTGPFSGAPRDPNLRVGDEDAYSTVRYSTDRYSYTSTSTHPDECARCGSPLVESHDIEQVQGDDSRQAVGRVRICHSCQADSWMLHSRMPTAAKARRASRKTII
jgi:hypothetical protein